MLRSVSLSAILLLGAAMPAYCQSAPTDKVTIVVTRAELQVIGNGLAELPYKTAAVVMNDLQLQLNAADQAIAKAAADAAKPKAAEPAPSSSEPAAAEPMKTPAGTPPN